MCHMSDRFHSVSPLVHAERDTYTTLHILFVYRKTKLLHYY